MHKGFLLAALFAASLAASLAAAEPRDFLPGDHGLRYIGHEGRYPVTVEITLRDRPDGAIEYVRWVTPSGWASWFKDPTTLRTRLEYRENLLWPLGFDDGTGEQTPPGDLRRGALDEFSVRLRARSDIVQGLREAEYLVWRGGDTVETWKLEVLDTEIVETPDGRYECFRVKLGNDTEWIEAWSAPLLLFHFVKIDSWRNGRKIAALRLDDKQL